MAFEIGWLLGFVLLLGLVVYVTRIRGPPIPPAGEALDREGPETEPCDICGRERVYREVDDLTVCPECDDEFMA